MAVVSTSPLSVSPMEALWVLYRSQTKRVREAFRLRILSEDDAPQKDNDMLEYERQLSPEVRNSVRMMAKSIKKNADDVRQAAVEHTHIGRSAEDFLSELEQTEV